MSAIAFLGLGAMGSRMAANLLRAGHELTVWNRDASKGEHLISLGATFSETPRAAASGAEFIFSMVSDDEAARAVWLHPQTGAIADLARGGVAIECSTVTPTWIRELSTVVAKRDADLLDAPVAGSRPQAEAGQLVFMVGGEEQAFERVKPIVEVMASRVMHVGPAGQGATLKLAINALFAAQLASVAEVLGFLSRNGFSATDSAELIGSFPIVAPPIAASAKLMAQTNTAPQFTIDLIEKDLRYIGETARLSDARLPIAEAAVSVFRDAQRQGLGGQNVSGILPLFI
jgi:3-hydroxyisobutyrate dehydrogenase